VYRPRVRVARARRPEIGEAVRAGVHARFGLFPHAFLVKGASVKKERRGLGEEGAKGLLVAMAAHSFELAVNEPRFEALDTRPGKCFCDGDALLVGRLSSAPDVPAQLAALKVLRSGCLPSLVTARFRKSAVNGVRLRHNMTPTPTASFIAA
jgi:hypothetical protein